MHDTNQYEIDINDYDSVEESDDEEELVLNRICNPIDYFIRWYPIVFIVFIVSLFLLIWFSTK
jgi:hypothetical protein